MPSSSQQSLIPPPQKDHVLNRFLWGTPGLTSVRCSRATSYPRTAARNPIANVRLTDAGLRRGRYRSTIERFLLLLRTNRLAALSLLFVGLLCGLAAWGGYEGVTAYFTTNAFCVSCHEMRGMADDYQKSIHFTNPAGVRAQCADCHVPKPFVARITHMVFATRDLIGHVRGVLDTPEKVDARRLDMAKSVWAEMAATDSLSCRGCHSFEAMDFARQRPKAAEAMHAPMPPGTSCINCHRGIAHRLAVVAVKSPSITVTPAAVRALPGAPAASSRGTGSSATTSAETVSKAFIGEAAAPLSATPGGPPIATLFVSAPVTVTTTEAGASKVVAALWMKAEAVAPGPLFAAPNGVEVGRLDAAANAKAGAARDGWIAVQIDGYVATVTVVGSLEPVWQAAESTYEFSCAV